MPSHLALDMVTILSIVVIVLSLSLLVLLRHYRRRVLELESAYRDATHSRRSLATTYGRITEQFAPFLPSYPFDPKNFRFLGSPVDGVQFEDDRVVFVEFKANTSRLTDREARIRELVEAGRVEWLEFRVHDAEGGAPAPAREDAPSFPSGWRREADEDDAAARDRATAWGAER